MLQRFIDEFQWHTVGGGSAYEFVDDKDNKVAEVTLADFESKLWKFEVIVPEKYQVDGNNPVGIVYSAAAAKKVAETILVHTILQRG